MAGFTNMVGSLYIFLVVKTYPAMAASMTTAGAYWFYASIRLLRNVTVARRQTSKINLTAVVSCPCPLASS